jgi:threonylcarbamoyladenosine tRNA methylthiotransferase MtaB
MGRRYTTRDLNATLREALRLMPDIALGADLICGFPGETEDAFLRTLAFISAPSFCKLHVFPYSERPGTPAAAFDGKIPESERKRRANRLIAQGQTNRAAFAQRFVKTPVECLIERFDTHGLAHGWSGEYLRCVIRGLPRDRRRTRCSFTPSHAQGDTLYGDAT